MEFFQLDYLDPDRVELGLEHEALGPLMWLVAGGRGERQPLQTDQAYFISEPSGFAVLFDPLALPDFIAAVRDLDDVRHHFLVTDDQEAFAEMTARLGPGQRTHIVPRDYLRRFRINTRQAL